MPIDYMTLNFKKVKVKNLNFLLTIKNKSVNIDYANQCGCGGIGRRAGLRNQCQRRGGSSPFIRTNNESVRTTDTKINQ